MAPSAASTPASTLAQPAINAIQQQITAMLPGSFASSITSQFAGASSATRQAIPSTPAAGAALMLPSSGPASMFLSLSQAA